MSESNTMQRNTMQREPMQRNMMCNNNSISFLLALAVILTAPHAGHGQCNTAPFAHDDTVLHTGDPLRIHVLANDEDLDGDALDVTLLATTCTATASEDFGTLVLTPTIDTSETCTVDYEIADGRGGTASARVTVLGTGLLFKVSFETGDISRWDEEDEP